MPTTDRTLILDILDRRGIDYEYHDRARKSVPGSAFEIEIHNSGKFSDDGASTIWIFDIHGNLLQIGSFAN